MNIRYIAILDHDHLDNGLFLTTFAKSISSHKERGLILHSDSAYTDRIMQTGVIRQEAKKRAIKDLNNRLIALLADHGVSAIGINGYQREMIYTDERGVHVDTEKFKSLPDQPVLLISSLIYSSITCSPVCASLPEVAISLMKSLQIDDLYLFTRSEEDDFIIKDLPKSLSDLSDKDAFIRNSVPYEFQNNLIRAHLTTVAEFGKYPEINNVTRLNT